MPWKDIKSDRQTIYVSATLSKKLIQLEYPGQQDIPIKTRNPTAPPPLNAADWNPILPPHLNVADWRYYTGILVGRRMSEKDCMKQVGSYGPDVGYLCCLQVQDGDYHLDEFSARCPNGKETKYYSYDTKLNPYYRPLVFEPTTCEVALQGTQRCGKRGSDPLNSSMAFGTAIPWTGPRETGFQRRYLENKTLQSETNSLFVDYWIDTTDLRRRDMSRLYRWMADLILQNNKNTEDPETGPLLKGNKTACAHAARRAMVHIAISMLSNACFGEGSQDQIDRFSKSAINTYLEQVASGYCSGLRQSQYGLFLGDTLTGATAVAREVEVAHKASLSLASSIDMFDIALDKGRFYVTFGIGHDLLSKVRKSGVTSVFSLQKLMDKFYEGKQTNEDFPEVELDASYQPSVKVVVCRVDMRGFGLSKLEVALDKTDNTIQFPTDASGDVFPAYYKVTARVKNVNPTLTAHFVALNPKMEISESLCSSIATYHPLMPFTCIPKLYKDAAASRAAMVRSCQYSYNFNFSLGMDINRKPLYMGADDAQGRNLCGCYNADLAPVFSREKDLTASRCFSSECSSNPLIRQAFAQSDDTCRPLCDKAWGWLNSSDALKRSSAKASRWDIVRFQSLCKQNIERNGNPALRDTTFSLRSFLFVAVPVLIMVSTGCGILSLARRNVSLITKAILVTISTVLCILVGFSTPSYRDCAGDTKCRSSSLNTPLPSSFCNESGLDVCECKQSGDCKSLSKKYGTCGLFGVCVDSKDGYRPTLPAENTKVHGDYILGSVVSSFCAGIVCLIILMSRSSLLRIAVPPLVAVFIGVLFLAVGVYLELSRKIQKYDPTSL
jgi:hypothetical protein